MIAFEGCSISEKPLPADRQVRNEYSMTMILLPGYHHRQGAARREGKRFAGRTGYGPFLDGAWIGYLPDLRKARLNEPRRKGRTQPHAEGLSGCAEHRRKVRDAGICTKKRDGSVVSRKAGRKYCIPKAYLKMNSAVTKWKRHPKGVAFGSLTRN